MKIKLVEEKKMLSIIAVLWIILSSVSLVYCVFNMKLCMAILGLITFAFVCHNRCIKKNNFYVFATVISIVFFNILINHKYTPSPVYNEEFAIMLIRCAFLAVIMSNISRDDFFHYYVSIMVVLSVVSLISFALTMMGVRLPFQREVVHNSKYYIYTFYHTLGRWEISDRNCGIFWEPGGYQIFLNFALLFLLTNGQLFFKKWGKNKVVISIILLISTILTTMSTTGFLCLALVLAIGILHRDGDKKIKRKLLLLIAISALVFIFVELNTGIIESKLINQEGSFATRFNDTIVSFKVGFSRLFGYGYGNTYTPTILASYGVTDNSNGLGSIMVSFGAPLTVLYLSYIYMRLKNLCQLSMLESILAFVLFLLFVMSESVCTATLFLVFLFFWKNESKQKSIA